MSKKIQRILIFIAFLLVIVIYLNQYILFKLTPKNFQNWSNDSLFYSISIILWSLFFPILYSIVKKFKTKKKVYLIIQILTFSFIVSIFHQICSNLIFYTVNYLDGDDVTTQTFFILFKNLMLTGIFVRAIESIIITFILYALSNNEKKIRNFIAAHWPSLYQSIVDEKNYIKIINVKEKGTVLALDLSDILWFNSSGNYIEIHHTTKKYLIRQTFANLLLQLDPQTFIRVHRSSIVNIDFIEKIDYIKNGEYRITLKDSSKITSSRNFKDDIKNKLKLKDTY